MHREIYDTFTLALLRALTVEYFAQKQLKELEARMAKLVAQNATNKEAGEIGVAVTGDAPAQPKDQGPVFACYYNAATN